MTREVFTPSPLYTIATIGPYPITHPYQVDTEIACTVFQGSTIVELVNSTDFTVAPSSSETTGDVTLSAAAFAAYTGASLLIRRESVADQGWAGQTAREKGLEAQLDALTQRLQEIDEAVARAIKLPEDPAPELPLDTSGLFLGFDTSNILYAGTPMTTTTLISPFMATLLDDPDAQTARATLDAIGPADTATITGQLIFSGNTQKMIWENQNAPANEQVWGVKVNSSGDLVISALNDSYGAEKHAFVISRSLTNISQIAMRISDVNAAIVEAAGTTMTNNEAIVTKEKGDARYAQATTGTFTLTLLDCTTSPTVTATWQKIGDFVTLQFGSVLATSNATTLRLSGLPADLRPVASSERCFILGHDNGADTPAYAEVASTGTITVYPIAGGAWTASGTKGVQECTLTYRKT